MRKHSLWVLGSIIICCSCAGQKGTTAQEARANQELNKAVRLMNTTLDSTYKALEQLEKKDSISTLIIQQLSNIDLALSKNGSWDKGANLYIKNNQRDIALQYKEGITADLNNYSSLLQQSTLEKNPVTISAYINFISEDVSAKLNNQWALETAPAQLVTIKVKVLDVNGKELPGYQVFVKPEYTIDDTWTEELNPTNNAEKIITPGRKLVWIQKNGTKLAERRETIKSIIPKVNIDFIITNL